MKKRDRLEASLFIVEGYHYNKWDAIESFDFYSDAEELVDFYLEEIKKNPKEFNWQKFRVLEQKHTLIREREIPNLKS